MTNFGWFMLGLFIAAFLYAVFFAVIGFEKAGKGEKKAPCDYNRRFTLFCHTAQDEINVKEFCLSEGVGILEDDRACYISYKRRGVHRCEKLVGGIDFIRRQLKEQDLYIDVEWLHYEKRDGEKFPIDYSKIRE